ncbi:MAG: EAL domain-containing protein [Betaproteobacteria bacterium]
MKPDPPSSEAASSIHPAPTSTTGSAAGHLRNDRLRAQLATYGLGVVLLVVSSFTIWSSVSTSNLSDRAINASSLADHYAAAAAAVAAQESLERKYRLEPSQEVRKRYAAAAGRLKASLALVARDGSAEDRVTVQQVLDVHVPYLESIDKMFGAVDRGDTPAVLRIDSDEVDPKFDFIESVVDRASDWHHDASILALGELRSREGFNSRATPMVFMLAFVLVALFSNVLRKTLSQMDLQRDRAVHDSLHDALTGLPNRTLLSDRFEQALRRGRREGSLTGLLLIDLDRFKEVNDTLGHQCGDRLLVQIGMRLTGALREVDTIARLGGDEFAVLLPSVEDMDAVLEVARRLRTALTQAFDIDDVEIEIEASIGAVISGQQGDDPATLMRHADIAMYEAKRKGLGIGPYDAAIDGPSPERLSLLGELRRGIARGELFLHYQPKVDLNNGQVTGVEALVRWQHPQRGLVRPDEFIPFAEQTGLIGPLTSCVLNLALAQSKAWADASHRIPVAVNISARTLLDDTLVNQVSGLLAHYGLPAQMLELELTESAIMLEPIRAKSVLGQLHALGVRIALDDFGVGYTSLAQLKTLPIDEMKIDKSFVLTMQKDRSNALIVRGVIDLGHNLGMSIVAEGVETAEALVALTEYGCDTAQGYHLCRPQSAAAFLSWFCERVNPPCTDVELQPTQEPIDNVAVAKSIHLL